LAGRDADSDMALTVEADTHFRRVAHARASVDAMGTSLIMTVSQLNQAVVDHVNQFSQDPKNIAEFHLEAQKTIMEAIKKFSNFEDVEEGPDIVGGISVVAEGFFKLTKLLLPEGAKSGPEFAEFEEAWFTVFSDLPKVDEDIRKHIDAYNKDAKAHELAHVVRICVRTAVTTMREFLPEEALAEVGKYFDGIEEIMDGVVESWTAFVEGHTVQGVAAAYDGLTGAAKAVLPASIQNDATYQTIMGVLDHQIASLNDYVLKFRRKLQESKVCWRSTEQKKKQQATTCPGTWAGFYYAGHGVCRKNAGLLQLGSNDTDKMLLEEAVRRKKKDNKPKPKGEERSAICDAQSEFKDHIGKYCYQPCTTGYVDLSGGTSCITQCFGEKAFPSTNLFGEPNMGDMCGASPQMLQMVIAEMLTAVVGAALKIVGVIQQMAQTGRVTAESLNTIIGTFVNASVAFVNPKCPVQR